MLVLHLMQLKHAKIKIAKYNVECSYSLHFSCSLPRGEVVVSAGDEDAITCTDIGELLSSCYQSSDLLSPDLGHVYDVRQRVPVLQQRRSNLYTLT